MASPLKTGKQSVALPAAGTRVSRIRRDPPPIAKQDPIIDRDERDRRSVAIGILTFTLVILVVIAGIASYAGWSPRQYTAHL